MININIKCESDNLTLSEIITILHNYIGIGKNYTYLNDKKYILNSECIETNINYSIKETNDK